MTQIKTIRRLFAPAFALLTVLCGLLANPSSAHAQAVYTADKGADIFVFGGFNYTIPDYGPDGVNNTGITLGGDYTRYFGWSAGGFPIDPSLEIRGTYAKGTTVEERTGMAGLRIHTSIKDRYHPYIDLLFGLGVIDYAPNSGYARDHGLAYSLGGGIDIDIIRHFQLKLDFQEQSWNLGVNLQQVPSGGNFTLSPMAYTIGVSYHVPFKSQVGPNSHNTKPDKEPPAHPAPHPATTPATAPTDTTAPPPAPAPADSTTGTATPPSANP